MPKDAEESGVWTSLKDLVIFASSLHLYHFPPPLHSVLCWALYIMPLNQERLKEFCVDNINTQKKEYEKIG